MLVPKFQSSNQNLDHARTGSTISTLLHDRINPKDCQVLSLGDSGFLQFLRVVSSDEMANPEEPLTDGQSVGVHTIYTLRTRATGGILGLQIWDNHLVLSQNFGSHPKAKHKSQWIHTLGPDLFFAV